MKNFLHSLGWVLLLLVIAGIIFSIEKSRLDPDPIVAKEKEFVAGKKYTLASPDPVSGWFIAKNIEDYNSFKNQNAHLDNMIPIPPFTKMIFLNKVGSCVKVKLESGDIGYIDSNYLR